MVEPAKKSSATPGTEGATASVQSVDERFEVDLGKQLPDLNSPRAKSYVVRDTKDPSASLFALVVNPGVVWRASALATQFAVNHRSLMRARTIGSIAVAGEKRRQAAIIFERPQEGARLSTKRGAIKEDILCGALLPQMLDALEQLHAKGVTHRALRPDNLFFANGREDTLVLGECVTALPGFDQPADFEPIERATASPQGRGDGSPACDLFALGVTLARLIDATDPPEKTDPMARVIARMTQGSFEVIAGHIKCGPPLRAFLASLLNDDPASRATIAGIRAWLDGAGAVALPKVPALPEARQYPFLDHVATQPRALARLFANHIDEAREEISKGHFSRWARSGMGQTALADEIEKLVGRPDELARKARPIEVDAISRICCLLDPTGPIAHRGLSIMPDGFVGAFAQATMAGDAETLAIISEMVSLGLPTSALRSPIAPEPSNEISLLHEAMRNALRWKNAASGVERFLYEYEHDLPCLSPLVIDQLPVDPAAYLRALDQRVQGGDNFGPRPVDRHGDGYIVARLPVEVRKKAGSLKNALRERGGDLASDLAMLSLLQESSKSGPLPNLATWLGQRLTAAFDNVHNKERRARLITNLKNTAKAGDLKAVLDLLIDRREIQADNEEYRRAQVRYDALGEQLDAFDRGRKRREQVTNLIGRQLGTAIGALVLAGATLSSLLGAIK